MPSGKRGKRPAKDKTRPAKDNTRPAKENAFSQLLVYAAIAPNGVFLAPEVSRTLGIPDCNTTRGLKKCHESFETVSAALDDVYTQSREYSGSQVACDHLALAILVIYSDMGEDTILRKRIISETQFLERTVALLASPWARETAVTLLSRLYHLCSSEVLPAVARFTSNILDCAEPHLDHLDFVESCVCVLSHAIVCAIYADTPDPELVAKLPRVLKFMLSVVLLPASTSTSFDHFIAFCHQTAPQYPAPFIDNPNCIDFLVACVRSPDICTRICSQRALIDACAHLAGSPDNVRQFAPVTPGVIALVQAYSSGTEPFIYQLEQHDDMLQALANEYKTNPNCSHSKLGQKLAALILHSETNVRACMRPGTEGAEELLEMLRVCEAAVRNAADKTNKLEVTADILRLQLLTTEGHARACPCVYAEEALKRNPSVPFFHYILADFACGRDKSITRVLYADKGLQCVNGMTDFVRQQLLYITVSHSLLVVSRMAQGLPSPEDLRTKEINALTKKALANAGTFWQVAPVDHNLMPSMIAIGTHIDMLRNGHMWKNDNRMGTSSPTFALLLDAAPYGASPPRKTLALDKIFKRMSSAWDTWGSTISRRHKRDYTTSASDSDNSDVDIAAWFEKLDMTPCSSSREFELQGLGVTADAQRYRDELAPWQLNTCSACHAGSVTLKKCIATAPVRSGTGNLIAQSAKLAGSTRLQKAESGLRDSKGVVGVEESDL
ncbi:hypothetical protein FB45DRAFT_1097265, partial [Roridomyces roridus]